MPGYTGDKNDDWDDTLNYRADEKFTVQLSDGQNEYKLQADILSVEKVTNDGTVSVDLKSGTELSGDAYFGLVHMDDTAVRDGLESDGTVTGDFVEGIYDGTDYAGTGPFGGTLELEYDDQENATWTYTTTPP